MEGNNSQNTSGRIQLNEVFKMPGTEVSLLIIMFVATISGTFGNILVINAVFRTKELRTVANYFIVNLALADICVSGIVNPFSIIGVLDGEQYFLDRPGLCEFVASFCLTACYCSLLSIGCISINRYIHICHKDLYPKLYTPCKGALMLIALWIVSFLLEMPNFFGFGGHGYDRKTLTCLWDRTAHYGYNLFFVFFGVCTPLVIIAACYTKIFIFAHQAKRKIAMTANRPATKAGKERAESMKLAKTLFAIFVCFCLCWTPYAIIVVSDVNDTFPMEPHSFSILIAHVNSSLNCILYGVFNRGFRRAYSRILCIDRCMKQKEKFPQSNFTRNITETSAVPYVVSTINLVSSTTNLKPPTP
ncbi:octopamine receptor Oamb-like [Liolophura sinensis]|uniref:octopamine receptor Oamb-like n=1 Tax=Liolophura sinensis TaxID=3198878 RepID=UPI0031582131